MNVLRRGILCLCIIGAILTAITEKAYALSPEESKWVNSGNPYGYNWISANGDYQVACTTISWQYVYDNLHISLPNWGHGGSWYGAADGVYERGQTPRVGAVACWSFDKSGPYGHVAYVTAVNNPDSFDVIEGGRSVDWYDHGVGSRTITRDSIYWPDLGFIYPGGSPKPTAELRVERKFYNPGDTVTFFFGGQNTSGTYTLGIYKSSDRYKTVDITGDSYSIQLDEIESYSAYMTSYSASGNGSLADSNWVDWQVLPLTAEIKADKTNCVVNDSVVLSLGGNNNHTFADGCVTLGVWRDGERIVDKNVYEDQFVVNCDKAGKYSAYMTAYGGGTYKDSNWVEWTVYQLSADLTVDKSDCIVEESVLLSFGGNNNLTLLNGNITLGVWRDGVRIVDENVNSTTYLVECKEPGNYSAYFTAYGGGSFVDSEYVYWTVKAPHHFSAAWSKDATDHWHDCIDADCSEMSSKAAHSWDAGTVTTAATYTADGLKTYACTVCGQTKTESVPKLEHPKYSVTFSSGGGSGSMTSQTIRESDNLILPACTFTAPDGKKFKAWSIAGNEYAVGASHKVTGNIIVTAVWQKMESKTQIINASKTASGTSVTIFCSDANATVFCASYDVNGRMIGIESKPVSLGQNACNFSFTTANSIKVFVLDAGYKPLCESESR